MPRKGRERQGLWYIASFCGSLLHSAIIPCPTISHLFHLSLYRSSSSFRNGIRTSTHIARPSSLLLSLKAYGAQHSTARRTEEVSSRSWLTYYLIYLKPFNSTSISSVPTMIWDIVKLFYPSPNQSQPSLQTVRNVIITADNADSRPQYRRNPTHRQTSSLPTHLPSPPIHPHTCQQPSLHPCPRQGTSIYPPPSRPCPRTQVSSHSTKLRSAPFRYLMPRVPALPYLVHLTLIDSASRSSDELLCYRIHHTVP